MARARVQTTTGKSIEVEAGATRGGIIGLNVYMADGTTLFDPTKVQTVTVVDGVIVVKTTDPGTSETGAGANTGTDLSTAQSGDDLTTASVPEEGGNLYWKPYSMYAVASGTDTYTASPSYSPAAYVDGTPYIIRFPNANTGAATLNLNSLGALALKYQGAALAGGEIETNDTLLVVPNGTDFDIVGKIGSPAIFVGTASGTDTYTVTCSPVPTAYATGQRFTITFTNANTGAATLNANTLGALAIQQSGAALTGGEIPAGATLDLIHDVTQLQIVGGAGSAGAAGPGYAATSTTSLAIASSGSKAFTTQTGLAYSVGARIRATSAAAGDWMEGVVTAYSAGVLTATMDLAAGSGTHADWNINLAGSPGADTNLDVTVFPGSPTNYQRVRYTGDANLGPTWAYWDASVGHWLSEQIFPGTTPGQSILESSNSNAIHMGPVRKDFSIYITRAYCTVYPSSPNSGSAYWTITFATVNAANTAGTAIWSFNTSGDTASNWAIHANNSLNYLLLSSADALPFYCQSIKTGAPGGLWYSLSFDYRLVLG